MNQVEKEMAELRRVHFEDPDTWLLMEHVGRQCEHRWKVVPSFTPWHLRGFFTVATRSVCTRCAAEA